MKAKIRFLYAKLRCSVWLIPTLFVLFSILAAFLFPFFDRNLDPKTLDKLVIIKINDNNARNILWIISTTFLGISSVLISISAMILARMTLHYGSAFLRTYLKKQIHQFVIGSAIGCFLYSMIIVNKIDSDLLGYPPLSTEFAVLWALCNLGLFIFFLQHTLLSMQASKLVSTLGRELYDQMMDYLYDLKTHINLHSNQFQEKNHLITMLSIKSGYLEGIDYDRLLKVAHSKELYFEIPIRQGEFIFSNSPILEIYGEKIPDQFFINKLRGAFLLGYESMPEQDLEFRVRQLVILAVRSLARGVNDPNTCKHCIDFLTDALLPASQYQLINPLAWNYKEKTRFTQPAVTFEGLMDCCFNEIRQNAPNNPAITIRLLERLALLASKANQNNRSAIKKHAQLILEGYIALAVKDHDMDDVYERYARVMKALMIPENSVEWLTISK